MQRRQRAALGAGLADPGNGTPDPPTPGPDPSCYSRLALLHLRPKQAATNRTRWAAPHAGPADPGAGMPDPLGRGQDHVAGHRPAPTMPQVPATARRGRKLPQVAPLRTTRGVPSVSRINSEQVFQDFKNLPLST
jgi:hypothetical protein